MTKQPEPPSEATAGHSTLPLRQIAGYPDFITNLPDAGIDNLQPSVSRVTRLRALDQFIPQHRADLGAALAADLTRWDAPPSARAAAESLNQPNCYAVVTGQQAGVATGPLYTLYKAIGAVRAARALAGLHPQNTFVPVFWIEADDHDFDEARLLTVLDSSGEPARLLYDDGDSRPRHVGDRPINPEAITALSEELRKVLLPTEFTDAALDLLLKTYATADETLADGFARAMYAILGDTPLVLASSRNPGLKRLAADVFAAEVRDPARLFDAVNRRTDDLRTRGLPAPIAPKGGALFITHNGERRALDVQTDGYRIRGEEAVIGREEMAALATSHPERFSPNVVLRPIVQDAIFPTAVYLGGPGELAYLLQADAGYAVFGLEAPATTPRPFVTLVEPKVRRTIESADIQLETLLGDNFDAAAMLIDPELDGQLDESTQRALDRLAEAYAELETVTHRIDPTLEKTLGSLGATGSKGVEDFSKRLRSALKKQQATETNRLESARTLLLPGGSLQERVLNPIYYVNKYGLERLRRVLAAVDLVDGEMMVVEI